MNNKLKTVLTVGVFDMFHYGHLRLLQRAKALGDKRIVAVQDSEYILKYKPDAVIVYTTDERVAIIDSLKYVDETIIYKDVDIKVTEVDFDILALGEDQIHAGFRKAMKYCKEHNKEIAVLERTKNISSSELKEKVETIFTIGDDVPIRKTA
jgi:cytidyltransferase-like protein